MPTSVNPFLVLLGISPGGISRNQKRAKHHENNYTPTIGKAHEGFDLEDEWKSNHWGKARHLCVTVLKRLEPKLTTEKCIALSGHLNLGTWQVGDGSDPLAVEPKIVQWLPGIIGEKLKPQILILLGLNGILKQLRSSWEFSALSFLLDEPNAVHPFDYDGKRSYKFKVWINPDASAYPRLVISMPNHPRRHPFGDPIVWADACLQASKIVRKNL